METNAGIELLRLLHSKHMDHYPHSLSYFNELVGGPRNGAKHLLNSNIDWGQDLLHLERWIEMQNDGKPVYLAFDNHYNPFALGIKRLQPWPMKQQAGNDEPQIREVTDGYYAISVNQLYEFPWSVRDIEGVLVQRQLE